MSVFTPPIYLPFAHLKKGASGHLLKSSGGHLVQGCSRCPPIAGRASVTITGVGSTICKSCTGNDDGTLSYAEDPNVDGTYAITAENLNYQTHDYGCICSCSMTIDGYFGEIVRYDYLGDCSVPVESKTMDRLDIRFTYCTKDHSLFTMDVSPAPYLTSQEMLANHEPIRSEGFDGNTPTGLYTLENAIGCGANPDYGGDPVTGFVGGTFTLDFPI